jgi:hypothetical protein
MRASLAHAAASLSAWPVAEYIRHHRDLLHPHASGLAPHSRFALAPYFPPADLDRVRIVERDPLPLAGLHWTATLANLAFNAPTLNLIEAITLDHVIAARSPMATDLLFHELVHVVQFRLLGTHTFAKLYARGFLRTGGYNAIPLEQCAYQLEARFAGGSPAFDVEREVANWIDQRRF